MGYKKAERQKMKERKKLCEPLYPKNLSRVRKMEFSRLKNQIYLDYTGASLYSEQQVANFTKFLKTHIFGNPHSGNPSSDLMSRIVDEVRTQVLQHFNATQNEYSVVFTSGTTASFKILAQSFNWNRGKSIFAYLEDNHTSVVGIREISSSKGASAVCLRLPSSTEDFSEINSFSPCCVKEHETNCDLESDELGSSLFVFPAQSNFTGRKYPLSWIETVRLDGINCCEGTVDDNKNEVSTGSSQWYIALDAAAFVPTSMLDLKKYQPDFVCMSFYKMFGFPTGIGALLVRNEAVSLLKSKIYFGGGTTDLYLATEDFFAFKSKIHEQLEEGTIAFLDILALKFGFETLQRITGSMDQISNHAFCLIKRRVCQVLSPINCVVFILHDGLKVLVHRNGRPAIRTYSASKYNDVTTQGPTVAFNVLKSDGSYVGYNTVLELAATKGIHLRGGCFCNYGACNILLEMGEDKMKSMHKRGFKCGEVDLVEGIPVGAIRASLGYISTINDVDKFLKFLKKRFVIE